MLLYADRNYLNWVLERLQRPRLFLKWRWLRQRPVVLKEFFQEYGKIQKGGNIGLLHASKNTNWNVWQLAQAVVVVYNIIKEKEEFWWAFFIRLASNRNETSLPYSIFLFIIFLWSQTMIEISLNRTIVSRLLFNSLSKIKADEFDNSSAFSPQGLT